jgi:[lysine-biosynthesis-protein LysW]--L-2-aminoadipate ligase
MKIGILCSRVRLEEKLLFRAFQERQVPFERIDVRRVMFDLPAQTWGEYDLVMIRCVSQSRGTYAARLLQAQGVRTVNAYETFVTCGDKVLTSIALAERGLPTPRTSFAFNQRPALEAVEALGYPAVLKSPVGSWGRLMGKVNDREAAETVLEHKAALERGQDTPFYVQDYVDKPGRDIRTMVIGDETVYAVYRHAEHWITNTARGGSTTPVAVAGEIDRLSRAAARAVGGGIVAVDLLEDVDGSLLINEINHTPEFHGAMQATDVDIPGRIVDYVLALV